MFVDKSIVRLRYGLFIINKNSMIIIIMKGFVIILLIGMTIALNNFEFS